MTKEPKKPPEESTYLTIQQAIDAIQEQRLFLTWKDLYQSWRGDILPKHGGLYAIRLDEYQDYELIACTMRPIKTRVSELSSIYRQEKRPGKAPHSSAPHLWEVIWEKQPGIPLLISAVAINTTDKDWLTRLRTLANTKHREVYGHTPHGAKLRIPETIDLPSIEG